MSILVGFGWPVTSEMGSISRFPDNCINWASDGALLVDLGWCISGPLMAVTSKSYVDRMSVESKALSWLDCPKFKLFLSFCVVNSCKCSCLLLWRSPSRT
ncbi:hypothetical protein AVEN_45844-1 [Araneus ventricosus]|uniref:Uncharacterized protein n=1 Tax=Araneus ventricosus TaxID=182803 RepID=A0A4Y2Q5T9_ARAVE|nr:hypothetical protein AVEN_45844-1 [Araneus ventricosus]